MLVEWESTRVVDWTWISWENTFNFSYEWFLFLFPVWAFGLSPNTPAETAAEDGTCVVNPAAAVALVGAPNAWYALLLILMPCSSPTSALKKRRI